MIRATRKSGTWIVCDHCGDAAPAENAVGTKTWHVGTETVSNLYGERVHRARHQCAKCVAADADDSDPHFPLVDYWYFVEAH